MKPSRTTIAAGVAWVLFWVLMTLVALEDYRRDGGTAYWQALLWESSSALVASLLDRDGPARRYLNEAVFPVYIVHQTLIVVMAHALQPMRLAPGLEGLLLVVLTVTLSFGLFESLRRVAVLRPLFGLAPQGVAAAPALRRAGSCPGPAIDNTAG